MSSSGFLNLVYESELEKYIIGNPEITYFKKIFRRHTNFYIETINQTWNGSNISNNNITECSSKIENIGDLISNLYLEISIFNQDQNNTGFNSKADKMLFEFKDNWIIVDVEELNKYVKHNNKKDILLKEILEKLDWNIILNKNE